MATYDQFVKKVQELVRDGCEEDEAIKQVEREWSNAEEAARHALLYRQSLEMGDAQE